MKIKIEKTLELYAKNLKGAESIIIFNSDTGDQAMGFVRDIDEKKVYLSTDRNTNQIQIYFLKNYNSAKKTVRTPQGNYLSIWIPEEK